MTTKLLVRGVRESTASRIGADYGGALNARVKEAVRIDVARTADTRLLELQVQGDDIIELTLNDGIRLWMSPEQLREDLGQSSESFAESGTLTLPPSFSFGAETTRGLGGELALKALRLLDIDLAAGPVRFITERLESGLCSRPGLYRWSFDSGLSDAVAKPDTSSNDRPLLLFLHGTASNTEGSFGALRQAEQKHVWERLAGKYGKDRIYTFEHRTLSESPIENAISLLQLLPEGARLHLVSQSRGGLIGELLCRARIVERDAIFDENDVRQFAEHPDRERLLELGQLLRQRRPVVERFVRVACPARGTTLASRRLDRYLSIIVNVLGMIPPLKASPVYDFTSSFLLAVVKKRTRPEELPGLEAMMPESAFIKVMNRPGLKVDADLSVIAGDLEGTSIWTRLKALAADLFFQENHDLVVNTSSMVGGLERKAGARYSFHKGNDVHHFSYFHNPETIEKLVLGLTRVDGNTAGFEPIQPSTLKALKTRTLGKRRGVAKPVVFLVPGIMGSHLTVNGNRCWLDPYELALGGIRSLRVEAENVEPEELVGLAYADLAEFLSGTHEVEPFPFDWRRSLIDESRRLGAALARKLGETDQPVRILAHSMGGLLARVTILQQPAIWKQLQERDGGRLVMLGTPNGGLYTIPRVLLGRERVIRLLKYWDFKNGMRELLEIVGRFPGLLEMLPGGPTGDRDFFAETTWRELHAAWGEDWILPKPEDLERAKKVRKLLDDNPADPKRTCYVAGRAPLTPVGIHIDLHRQGRERVRFIGTPRGDGRVPWDSGPPAGVPTWYMDAEHGKLAAHRPAFQAIQDLLQSGDTSQLPRQAPVTVRGLAEYTALPEVDPQVYPNESDVLGAAIGFGSRLEETHHELPLRAGVTHGSLAFTSDIVAVGHYVGDSIVGAEAFLDAVLGGRLTRRRQLGLYPGKLGTSAVLLNEQAHGKPGAALIVGLGEVGEITAGKLTSTLTHAALDYALTISETPAESAPVSRRRPLRLQTLLLGTGYKFLRVEDSMSAILDGVIRANRALREIGLTRGAQIEEVEFLEISLDLAVQAQRALQRLHASPRFFGRIDVKEQMTSLAGGRRRITTEETPGWWQRWQIRREPDDSLRFTLFTERARAEVSLVSTQRALLDRYLDEAVGSTESNQEVAATLFELLLPNQLKQYAADERDIVLVVDQAAAAYPWELLGSGVLGGGEPPAVRAGLIRQLETTDYREQVTGSLSATALVVGDPLSDFPPLPAARAEAEKVAEMLAEDFSVNKCIGEGPRSIVNALFARPYRILHLAGHGVYEHVIDKDQGTDRDRRENGFAKSNNTTKISGMVLGKGAFLTPAEIAQMRYVPEFVFINCCYLGRIESHSPHRLAANVASQLIEMGVRAVVAAGWAVNDDAARTFAEELYRGLLDKRTFGEAVFEARRAAYSRHPSSNTWGAYQCYGDPDYVLLGEKRPSVVASVTDRKPIVVDEALLDLENIVQDASSADGAKLLKLRKRVLELEQDVEERWPRRADLQAALGRACGELDIFDRAVTHYERALAAERAVYTVRDLEQLANLRSRWAVREWHDATDRDEGAARPYLKRIDDSIEDLSRLPRLSGDWTVERLCLLGAAYKRRSQISGLENDFEKMAEYYEKAHHLGMKAGPIDPYPLLNWLACRAMRTTRGSSDALEDLNEWLDNAQAAAEEADRREPAFWMEVAEADVAVVRHLAAGCLASHEQEVVSAYRRAAFRGSPREFRSVLEHLEWMIDALNPNAELPLTEGNGTSRLESLDSLRSMRAKLEDLALPSEDAEP